MKRQQQQQQQNGLKKEINFPVGKVKILWMSWGKIIIIDFHFEFAYFNVN